VDLILIYQCALVPTEPLPATITSSLDRLVMTAFVSYAQNFEDVMLWRALRHVELGYYVDIGAQHPVTDSVSKAFYEHGWRGVHIEPVPEWAALLRQDRPDEIVIEAAIGDRNGILALNIIPDTGLSTALTDYALRHQADRGYAYSVTRVPCLTFADALRDVVAGKEVHWLKIDVEGFEKEVLSGWEPDEIRPWIIVVEATIPNSPEPDFERCEPILTRAGYHFCYFDGLNRFYMAKEHPELFSAFGHPPCVFDNFKLALQVDHEARVERAEALAHTAEARAETAEAGVQLAETAAQTAEARAQDAQTTAQAAEARVLLAEASVQTSEARVMLAEATRHAAEARVQLAEATTQAAEARVQLAETATQAAETRAQQAETIAQAAEVRIELAEKTAKDAEARAREAEIVAQAAEARAREAETAAQAAEATTALARSATQAAEAKARTSQSRQRAVTLELRAKTEHANWMEARYQETEQRLDQLSTEIRTLIDERRRDHDFKASLAQTISALRYENAGLVSTVAAIYSSTSWKVTQPLRGTKRAFRAISRLPLIVIRRCLEVGLTFIRRNRGVAPPLHRILSHFPQLQARLYRFAQLRDPRSSPQASGLFQKTIEATVPPQGMPAAAISQPRQNYIDASLAGLSPHAQRIYAELKAAIARKPDLRL